jgi:hypothetical protein
MLYSGTETLYIERRLNMHGYFWKRNALQEKLQKYFADGQIQVETSFGEVYRGGIRSYDFDSRKGRTFRVNLEWLCEKRLVFETDGPTYTKWPVKNPPGSGYHSLDIFYTVYYPQGDEGRIKLWTHAGEIVRFYRRGDYTNLICREDSFVPLYETFDKVRWKCAMIAILTRKPKPRFI